MRTYPLKPGDWLIVFLAAPLIHLLGLTLRIREQGRSEWGPRAQTPEPPLWSLWHETILMSVWYHRRRDVHVMISASRDGELISTIAKIFGYVPVRGSSSKGGKEAAAELVEYLKAGKRCAITPDGPRGPRRELKAGVAKIAALAGRPVVPFAFGAEKCWRLKSWDRFMVPKPFSRAVFVYGEPLRFQGGDEGEFLKAIQAEMDRLQRAAEGYFDAGKIS
ncbi:MAG TPA: lysophospholipid acyltransferase family protein [bacterium]|nr:lysophospholipid acyltransferase family protein [bacterium]